MTKQEAYYKWVILIASFILMAVPFSILNAIHTLFITPVTETLGFSLSAFSLVFTIGGIVVAIASPLVGKLLNTMDIRIIMSISALFVGFGFIGYGFATNILLFYLISIMTFAGLTGIGIIPISTMMTHWFLDKRGAAMGFAFAGAGIGTFFWMQIVSRMIQNNGYQYAYSFLGGIILLVSLPICLFVVVKSPTDKFGRKKIATETAKQGVEADKGEKGEKADFKKMSQNPAFWFFSVGLLLMGIAIAGTQIHVQSYLVSVGYPLTYNANIGSIVAISAMLGSILGGMIFDKLDAGKALLFFGGLNVLGLVALILSGGNMFPYIFAVTFGFSLCLPSLWPSYGVGKIFADENYSATLGIVNMFFVFGGAAGPFLSGLIADSPLGYKAAWSLYLVLTLIYLSLFIKSVKKA